MSVKSPLLPGLDFNVIRQAFISLIAVETGLPYNVIITEEPETQDAPRPDLPYLSMKITRPADKSGDDTKTPVPGPGNVWNSGGVRMMTIGFNAYGRSHEEAYNYMSDWQCALDREDVQQTLRSSGIAVWTIGNVADLSQLLNTGYEGRAHMDCTFGIAMNTQSDLGEMNSVTISGTALNGDEIITQTQSVSWA